MQAFMKRLRKATCRRLRFFGVGEYGDRSFRPHYHLCVFGLEDPRVVEECWRFGFVHIGFVEPGSVEYITGYCTKGFTRSRPELEGRTPEFCLMSTHPGIGAGLVDNLPLMANGVALEDALSGRDVPWGFRVGGRVMPMGSYLRNRLRKRLGREPGIPEEELRERTLDYWRRMKIEEERLAMEAERDQHRFNADSLASRLRAKRIKV